MKKIVVILSLFCGIYLLPQIASNSFGKHVVENYLSRQLGAEVHVSELSLSWFGGQKCSHISIAGSNQISYEIEEFKSPSPLLQLIRFQQKSASLKGGKIVLEDPKGLMTIISLLKKKKKTKQSFEIVFSSIDAKIEDGALSLEKTSIFLDNSIEVIASGTIDLKTYQADLILGIPQKSIKKLVGNKELPANFILEVPLSGKLDQFFLDKIPSKVLAQFLQTGII